MVNRCLGRTRIYEVVRRWVNAVKKIQGRFVAPRASQYVAEGSCRTVREICGQQDIASDQLIKS